MKNLLSKLPKTLLAFGAALFATVAFSMVAMASFGPDRATRVWTPQENGFNHVTFNSYTGVTGVGDERDFLRGVVKGRDSQWTDPIKDVSNNDTVTAKIYIHNDADPLLNDAPGKPGVAKNVRVSIDIPTGLDKTHEVTSSISADNAKPQSIFDTLDVDSINDSLFQLSYVPGSAKLGGTVLSDSIFTTAGLNIGDQNGCFKYLREITFEMKVEKPGYQIQKSARLKGEDSTKWRKVVNAKRGDSIEWRISFQNIGSTRLNNVKVVDDLPSYTEVVPGSVEIVNSAIPNGYKYDSSAIQNNGDMVNVDIADYAPGSNAFLYLETKIKDVDAIRCGTYQITNVAYVTPAGLGTLNDNAKVNIINDQECVEPIVSCDSLNALFFNNKMKLGDTVNLKVGFTAIDVSLDSIVFKVDGKIVQDGSSNEFSYTPTVAGEHTISATLMTSQGPISSEACNTTIKVQETKEPAYTCEEFKLTRNDRKVTVSFVPKGVNGAKFKDALVEYSADGVSKESFTTNKLTNGRVITSHTFNDSDVNVKAVASIRFSVKKDNKVVVKEVTCRGSAVLGEKTENCTIPGKENLPKDSKECKTPELPNTGPGSIGSFAGLFLLVTVAGTTLHRKRTLSRQ